MSASAEFARQTQEPNRKKGSLPDIEKLKATFAEDGYLIFRDVVSKEKLSALRASIIEEFERATRSGNLFSGGGLISGHLNCFPGEGARFAYEALEANGIVDLVKTLFPKAVRPPNVGCNFNLPNSVAQHYHADRNFIDHFMIANVAVVDTDVANGAIDLVPGTHKKFYKFWRFAVERPHRASIRVPMKQGDVLVRTSNVWHRGMPNRTTVARPMLAFTWEDGGSTREDPFKVEDGKIKFRENWYRPNLLGRMRERTFVVAPITYSAYRFVGSLFGSKGYDRQ
jgi:ectoine hydroxylase-related dioxygenase (phytanoyl-CoA dioxygenase family)